MPITTRDRVVLRDLAKRVRDVAALPVMEERRRLWKQHNALRPVRPMILVFPEGSWEELLPGAALTCEDKAARSIEWNLRSRIYNHEHLHDDSVIESDWVVYKAVRSSGWGLEPRFTERTAERGSFGFDPVLKDRADLKKLHAPEITYDEAETLRNLQGARELFGDILEIKLRGVSHVSFHLIAQYTKLRGLAEGMMDMAGEPQLVHDAMAILEEGNRRLIEQYQELNLLSLNDDGAYHSSGGVGYTDELPAPDFDGEHVRPCDMWASAESQEMARCSPRMHEEFCLTYEKRLLAPFALNGYGCCEDLTDKLDYVFKIPHLRRISIAPFANVDRCAERLRGDYIFSWKPHPAHLVGEFNRDRLRAYIRHTIQVAQENGCVLEMILKDTHTCEHHPERFTWWTEIARELVQA